MYVVGGVSGGEGAVVQGNWNKESMIRKVLQDTPPSAADWVLWLDVDTVLPQAGMLPRFDQYGGRDLVVWGDAAKLDAGNMNGGKTPERSPFALHSPHQQLLESRPHSTPHATCAQCTRCERACVGACVSAVRALTVEWVESCFEA